MNMISARLVRVDDRLVVSFGEHSLAIDGEFAAERAGLGAYVGADVVVGIRPEALEDAAFATGAPAERTLTTVCTIREALGSEVLVHFQADPSSTFVARVDPETSAREGQQIRLVVDTRRLHFFDPGSGLAI
jgi:multiple sugar transport system ATP-binding protein